MTTQQASEDNPMNRNPDGKGGFGDNPDNRNPGGWKAEDSISYQYNKFLRMTDKELETWKKEVLDKKLNTQAMKIAYERVKVAKSAIDSNALSTAKEITDRTEGKAPQSIDLTSKGEKLNIALVEFVDGSNQDEDTDSDSV